jgi:hypothetical protein
MVDIIFDCPPAIASRARQIQMFVDWGANWAIFDLIALRARLAEIATSGMPP